MGIDFRSRIGTIYFGSHGYVQFLRYLCVKAAFEYVKQFEESLNNEEQELRGKQVGGRLETEEQERYVEIKWLLKCCNRAKPMLTDLINREWSPINKVYVDIRIPDEALISLGFAGLIWFLTQSETRGTWSAGQAFDVAYTFKQLLPYFDEQYSFDKTRIQQIADFLYQSAKDGSHVEYA